MIEVITWHTLLHLFIKEFLFNMTTDRTCISAQFLTLNLEELNDAMLTELRIEEFITTFTKLSKPTLLINCGLYIIGVSLCALLPRLFK